MPYLPNQISAPERTYLSIGPSTIPNAGIGLFTHIKIYKDEIISIYKGKVISQEKAKKLADDGKDKYFITTADGNILDSYSTECFAKYANDASILKNSNFKNNSKIAMEDGDIICLIATRNIKPGDEIFCGYGRAYWKKHGVGI
ncbi:MAG: SET domain-containing protein-lysine N-methyltransferase [Saprospiraceae bacterium]|nr:SET domain-containing protein-lysine N-methyltransferase [Saprospiraceae bacterium]